MYSMDRGTERLIEREGIGTKKDNKKTAGKQRYKWRFSEVFLNFIFR